jgi:hypothetical protein
MKKLGKVLESKRGEGFAAPGIDPTIAPSFTG